jgi:hypothetical protein
MNKKELGKLYDRLKRSIEVNFPEYFAIDAKVVQLSPLTLSSLDGGQKLRAKNVPINIENIKENDLVRIKARLLLDAEGHVVLEVFYIYPLEQEVYYSAELNNYQKMRSLILSSRIRQKILSRISPDPLSRHGRIQKIIFISFRHEDLPSIEGLKKDLRANILGVHLGDLYKWEHLSETLEAFRNGTDLFVLLCHNLDLGRILALSSKTNLKYFLGRPNDYPYIVAIINLAEQKMEPLWVHMADRVVPNCEDFYTYLKDINDQYQRECEQLLDQVYQQFQKRAELYQKRLRRYHVYFSFGPKLVDLVEQIKTLACQRLEEQKRGLKDIKLFLLEQIMQEGQFEVQKNDRSSVDRNVENLFDFYLQKHGEF